MGARRLLGTIPLFVAAVAAPTLRGQQPPTFRSKVELIQVDVIVVDKDGEPIRGLRQPAFTLLDRGTPQAIATFEEVSHEAPLLLTTEPVAMHVRKDVADNRGPQARRVVVLVLDDLHIWKGRSDRAKQIAHDVINQLAPQSSMAVLFTSGDHNVQLTTDPGLLSAGVDTLKGRQSWPRPHTALDNQRRNTPGIALQDFFDNMAQYQTLENAAKMLATGDARRKAFVLVSEGIGRDLSDILGTMQAETAVTETRDTHGGGGIAALMGSRDTVEPYHAEAIIRMMDAMRRSNVATYAIDPRGLVTSEDLGRECFPSRGGLDADPCSSGITDWNNPVRLAQQGLDKISRASGGFAVTNTDDFTTGLGKIVSDLDHYYLLGFYPSGTKGNGYRRLDVKTTGHPDWIVRFRGGYQPDDAPKARKVDPLAKLSAGLMPATDLPLRIAVISLPGSVKGARVEYSLEVSAPVSELREADGKLHDTLRYELLVADQKRGKVTAVRAEEAHLRLSPISATGARPQAISYQVDGSMELSAGRYQFRVSAISEKLGKGGSVYLDVDVPNFSDAVALGGIAIGYTNGPHMPVAESATGPLTHASTSSGRGEPTARRTRVLPFAPTIDRVFSRSDTLRVYVPGAFRDQHRDAALTLNLIGPDARPVMTRQVPFANGHAETTLPLQTLDAGVYVLRATLSDGVNTSSRDTLLVVK